MSLSPELYSRAVTAAGKAPANRALMDHGGSPGRVETVPSERAAACAEALRALAFDSEHDGDKKPQNLEDLAPAAWNRFNNPPDTRR